MHLDIFFRSCSRVYAVHGGARVVDATKSEIILACLNSLIRSTEDALEKIGNLSVAITVIDDHSEPECIRSIRALLSACRFQTSFVSLESTGNGASLNANYHHARDCARELIYLAEDDYLHFPTAIYELIDAFTLLKRQFEQDVVLFPCDYPDRYREPYPSLIVLGINRYWRSVKHSTGTFLITKGILDRFWDVYLRFSDYGIDPSVTEDSTINQIYHQIPCFSPMPSLAVHVAYPDSLSPFVDWQQTWTNNQLKLRSDDEG